MANRVTTNMMYGSMMGALQNNLQKLLNLQTQLATQRKYSKLSENPSEIARALSLESSIKANEQYIANQQSGKEMLINAETAMDEALSALQTIRDKVIEAGNPVLGSTEVAAIADEIDAAKDRLLSALNTKDGAGKYIFGGTNTATPPFVTDASGKISYVGSDERIRYEIEQGVLSDVSFTGADVMPAEYQSYFICSHYVGLDWGWTGREEKVQISVGNRTLAVYIPEDWVDEVASGKENATDYNQFRDPGELSSISLDDLAALVNRSLAEQGADMLVTASVEKDYDANQQRLVFKSNTGEPISVVGWPDTDYLPMAQTLAGLLNPSQLVGSAALDLGTMTGQKLTVSLDGVAGTEMDLDAFLGGSYAQNVDGLAAWMNTGDNGDSFLPAGVTASVVDGKIAFTAASGVIQLTGTGVQAVTNGLSTSSLSYGNSQLVGSAAPDFTATMTGQDLIVSLDGKASTLLLETFLNDTSYTNNAVGLAAWMNTGDNGDSFLPAGVTASVVDGKIAFIAASGTIQLSSTGTGVEAVTNGVKVSSNYWNQSQLVGAAEPDFKTMTGTLKVYLDGILKTPTPVDLSAFPQTTLTADAFAAWLDGQLASTGVDVSVVNGKIAFTSASGGKIQLGGTGVQAVTGSVSVSDVPQYQGLMGTVNTLGWKGDGLDKKIAISIDGANPIEFDLDEYGNISELVKAINGAIPSGTGADDESFLDFASIVGGRLVLQSAGAIEVKDAGTDGGTLQLFGYDGPGNPVLKSSSSSLTIQVGEAQPIKIYINEGDSLKNVAERISAIDGLYARTSADGSRLVVVAQRTGDLPEDPLAVDAATEKQHYPTFSIWGEGMAMSLFGFDYSADAETGVETGVVTSKEQTRPTDHSHMDVFDYLGMETALKSREYKQGETLEVGTYNPGTGAYEGDSLHWRITSGSHSTEITILPGEYTLAQLAERLQNAASGWLEVNLDVTDAFGVAGPDDKESGVGTSANAEAATSRLVIRSTDGSPVTFMDMNKQRYAEEIGLSTALRADKDTTGVKTIVLPSAPCLDGNLAAAVRVQMTCGKTYDIRLARKDIMNADGTAVDRVKVMEQIAKQVNAQEGSEVLKVVLPVDEYGKAEDGYASLVAVTGEPFEVVDLPILDPNWSASYTAGIAAQMGIHGGVTSNLELAHIKDDTKMGTDRTGTIRFESLGRSVEIDVTENDTVKTIMDRLRSQAGDWLYVNYFDENMGGSAGQEGDYPIVAVAAKDGSAVNIIDVKGTVAEKLMLSTGIQGTETVAVYANRELDITQGNGTWQIPAGGTPQTFNITVAGYTHTIDLTAMRDINGNNVMDIEDLVAEINSRMQDDDVKAELNDDGKLVLWSPRGYSIQIGGVEDATDISTKLTSGAGSFTPGAPGVSGNPGTPSSASVNAYRGGYGLDVSDAALREGYSKKSVYAQNVVTRSGANQTKQNFFGVLDDISAAVRAENRDGLSGKLLPQIEKAIDTLLRLTATSGALQSRYENNVSRMQMTGLSMTESHDELVGVELADISTELMMAQAIYQASLGVISYIIQPTLLDFLR